MPKGSTWRKWDIHTHTKGTNKNDQFASSTFDEFFQSFFLAALSNGIDGIGITDYFSIENYKKAIAYIRDIRTKTDTLGHAAFSDDQIDKITKIYLLPNIELRMLPCTGVEKLINIHIIANPAYIDNLDNDLFSNIENQDRFKMNRTGITDYGKSLPGCPSDDAGAYYYGVNNFAIDPKSLKGLLDSNKRFRENTLIAVSNSNKDGASGFQEHYSLFEGDQSSLHGVRKTIYDISDIIFSGNPKDIRYFLGERIDETPGVTQEQKRVERIKVIKERGSLKPCLVGSDAHKESELFRRTTWIKSDLHFDGLKQVIFEPKYRVKIADSSPIDPLIRIGSVRINFPEGSKIGNEKFCFSGIHEIEFSSNFTCIIGGRGTGKSTLLNLLHEKMRPRENSFFRKYQITDHDGSTVSIQDCVSFDDGNIDNRVEYLGQNEIEEFAKEQSKLTTSIYSRIKKKDEFEKIQRAEAKLSLAISNTDLQIKDLLTLRSESSKLVGHKTKLAASKKIVESFSSDDYKEINKEISVISGEQIALKNAKQAYGEILNALQKVIDENPSASNADIYSQGINKILSAIQGILNAETSVDFSGADALISESQLKLEAQKTRLHDFLNSKGLTEDSRKDIEKATTEIALIESEIFDTTGQIDYLRRSLQVFREEELESAKQEFIAEISDQTDRLSRILETLESTSLKPISIKFDFDYDSAESWIFEKFKKQFEEQLSQGKFKGDAKLREVLFCQSPLEITTQSKYLETLKKYQTQSLAKPVIAEILAEEIHFEVFRLICKIGISDALKFKKITVQYDGRGIESSSFGQRCTAVLVILLLLGNTPVIIDEPEAHLDSLLISSYLVGLIKEKKMDRQIIFATHNANFVINGDAELINIFSIDADSKTTKNEQTTIENERNRNTLISLEGGKEAFIQRENKYQFS